MFYGSLDSHYFDKLKFLQTWFMNKNQMALEPFSSHNNKMAFVFFLDIQSSIKWCKPLFGLTNMCKILWPWRIIDCFLLANNNDWPKWWFKPFFSCSWVGKEELENNTLIYSRGHFIDVQWRKKQNYWKQHDGLQSHCAKPIVRSSKAKKRWKWVGLFWQ